MKSYFHLVLGVFTLLAIIFLLAPAYSASVGIDSGKIQITSPTVVNGSSFNVNNSQYLQGYTPTTLKDWIQGFFDSIYCKLTGCTMTGNLVVSNANVTADYFLGDGSKLTGLNVSGVNLSGNHADLSNLEWSSAGHVIDTKVDFNNNSIENVSTINATRGYFQDVYVENSTLYIGDSIKISAGGAEGAILNISGGNVSSDYYFGSGLYLTDINLTGISFDGGEINASIFRGNFTGAYDWIAETPYLIFNRTYLYFNETKLNSTVGNLAQVKAYNQTTTIITSGGEGMDNSISLNGFQITRITVTPDTNTTTYNFFANLTASGTVVDQNRISHTNIWSIRKNQAINSDTLTYHITNSSLATETFNIKLEYINNFQP